MYNQQFCQNNYNMKLFFKSCVFILLISGCKSTQTTPINPIKDLPKEINERYVIPLVGNKETALSISKLIIKERYQKVNVEALIVDKAILVADEKVWEIVLKSPVSGFMHVYNIRINKNTGEVLNFWVAK